MKRENTQRDWDELASIDAMWAVITDPAKRFNRWDEEGIYATGKKHVDMLMDAAKKLEIDIKFEKVMDFGCGIGRISYALLNYFDQVYGVDISDEMLALARKRNIGTLKPIFIQNCKNDLSLFSDQEFDFIISVLTLQHLPDKRSVISFLKEFIRVLKPGGLLIFQLPSKPTYSFWKSVLLGLRSRLYYWLIFLGVPKDACYHKLNVIPYMHMQYLKKHEIYSVFYSIANLVYEIEKNGDNTYYFRKL